MKLVGRRNFISLLVLILVPAVFFVLIPTRIRGSESPSVRLVVIAPTEPLTPPAGWVNDLEHRLKTYFTKKYPAYDFSPYEQELDRIRSAVSRRDRWGAKREMGVFLQMLLSHAYGLGNDAAEELAGISHRIMPEEEFGIVYPGSGTEP